MPTVIEFWRERKVKRGLPLLPYSSMAINGFVWVLYGWVTGTAAICLANGLSLVLAMAYCVSWGGAARRFIRRIPTPRHPFPSTAAISDRIYFALPTHGELVAWQDPPPWFNFVRDRWPRSAMGRRISE
mmetsp:Transcript_100885/g.289594  ORF Transcript_100885/g.289594 Transcript_100885/m.289594 type:complete len:129 (-) Transcript_100885:596-982(-)